MGRLVLGGAGEFLMSGGSASANQEHHEVCRSSLGCTAVLRISGGEILGDLTARKTGLIDITGGDLSVILRRLDSTIRARNHVAGTVRSLTAEGRISGLVLSALPPGLMLVVQFLNPGFLDPLFTTSIGQLLLAVAVVQMIVGSIGLSRMAKFKF